MTQTKADRREAGKKAAATRERNETRARSEAQGLKAASTRQANAAVDRLNDAKNAVGSAAGGLVTAGKSAGTAATELGKSAASRVQGLAKRGN